MSVATLLVALAACGLSTPTPAPKRPPLPPPQPMPGTDAAELVGALQARDFECWFDRGGDIPSSWHCDRGRQGGEDYLWVRIAAARNGPVTSITAERDVKRGPEVPIENGEFNGIAAEAFAVLVDLVVPADHRPTGAELADGVARNSPIELGGGWYVGFDRSSVSRTLYIVFAADPRSSRTPRPGDYRLLV